jgi:scyllo-inositol 2-dehydrogenase (NADP+)
MAQTPGPGDLRVGLLGYGLAGAAFHAPLLATTPGLALSVVVTSSADRAEAIRARYPGVRVAASADDVLDARVVDLVVVATPNVTHVPLATRAIEAGLDVVVDKPVAASAVEARALQALATERGRLLTVYQNRRWDSDLLTLRAVLAAGTIGEVRRFESRFEGWSPTATGGWRESADPDQAGGLLYDLGAHLVDQAVQLFGPVARVYAEADVRRPGVGAVDDVFVALHHADGVRCHLWMSKVAAHRGPRLRVLGSDGAFVAHDLDPQEAALRAGRTPGGPGWGLPAEAGAAEVFRGDERVEVPLVRGDYGAFYAAVEEAVRTRSAPPVSVEEAAAVLDVLAAAAISARDGLVVPVPA